MEERYNFTQAEAQQLLQTIKICEKVDKILPKYLAKGATKVIKKIKLDNKINK